MSDNLIDIYSKYRKDLNKYNASNNEKEISATNVCDKIDDLVLIVKSNYELFNRLLKKSKTKEIELTKIVNEKLSYNGSIMVDELGYLYIRLNKPFNDKDIVGLSFNRGSSNKPYSLCMENENDEYDLKGFFTDTPEELLENFCKKIKPIYNELIANMSGKPENIK